MNNYIKYILIIGLLLSGVYLTYIMTLELKEWLEFPEKAEKFCYSQGYDYDNYFRDCKKYYDNYTLYLEPLVSCNNEYRVCFVKNTGEWRGQ